MTDKVVTAINLIDVVFVISLKYLWLFSHLVDEKSFISFRHSPVFTRAGSAEAGIQSSASFLRKQESRDI